MGAVYNREYNGRIMAATASVSLRQTFTNSTIFVHTNSFIFVHTISLIFLYCLHMQFLTLIIQICCMFASSCGQHCRLSIRSNFGSVYQILSNTSKSKYQLMVRRSGLSMQMQNIFEPTFLDFHFARFLATFIQIQIHESGPFVV